MHSVKSVLVVALATSMVAANPGGHALRRRAGQGDKDSSSLSLPTISSSSAGVEPSVTLVGTAPFGTGISSAPVTTQDVVITDVVYTTLTTCPITSLVTSGSTSFEKITTTISTVTRTSTSTLCTKCVAPPSKPAVLSSSPGETAVSSLPSFIVYSLSQPSLSPSAILTSSAAAGTGTGGLSAILLTNTIPTIPLQTVVSSKPEVPGTAASPSQSLVFPNFISLTVSATLSVSSTPEFPGYGIVQSPPSTPGSPKEQIFSNATSSTIPVYTAALLGNAYGGGFVGTPSVFVTKLPYPNGPASGVPPGYGSESSLTIIENNVTAVFTGLGASSTPLVGLQSSTEIGVPVLTATIASNFSVPFGSLGASTISASISENGSPTPTFISLSPFGGEIGQESGSTVVPTVISIAISNSTGSGVVGIEASGASSGMISVQTGSSELGGANVITALIAATSPASALSAEVSKVSNAVLSSLAAAGLPTSPISIQVAVVGPSTTSIIGSSGVTADSSFPISTATGGVAALSTLATASSLGAGPSSFQAATGAQSSGSSSNSPIGLAGVIQNSVIPATTVAGVALSPTFSSSGVNVETTFAGSPALGEVSATIIPSLPADQTVGPVVTLAVGSSAEQIPFAGQPATSIPTPILIANGTTALAVIPSPIVGANGLTSLAVFSTPIAPAAGLTTPAVLLTPIVGANGLTSLAVVATPVVGVNGLTSLAIGFETEITPTAGRSSSAPSSIEEFVVVQPPAFTPQVSGGIPSQANIAASGTEIVVPVSGSAETPITGGSGSSNYSIHVLLNPTATTEYQGSAVRLSLGFGVGLLGFMVCLAVL